MHRLIEQQDEFDRYIESLRGIPLVALDTEAASFHRYHDRVYLLQLSTRADTVVVDPLQVTDFGRLRELVADATTEIVFHDADYDLRLLAREHGFSVARLFDTRVAAQLLNEPGIGLAALLEKYLGVTLDKKFQRADWSARPLTDGMLEYAASDTAHLPALRDLLHDRLVERGRLAWAMEEFAQMVRVRWAPDDEQEPGWLRMKGAKALKSRELAVLKELFEWRDALARKGDRAPFRILNNEPMLEMAKAPPGDLEALAKVRGIGRDTVERRGRELLAAIQRGLANKDHHQLRPPRPPRPEFDPTFEERLERLKQARNKAAESLDLQPGVLCPNGTLEQVVKRNPRTEADLVEIAGMRAWQREAIGAALVAALHP